MSPSPSKMPRCTVPCNSRWKSTSGSRNSARTSWNRSTWEFWRPIWKTGWRAGIRRSNSSPESRGSRHWDRVRNRPQRNPLHTYTVDRHLVETAARAAALTRDVARPDLLLLSALMHDIGKGWPGDHRVTGEVVARDVARRVGLGPSDAELVAGAVRHHLLLPQTATRRDLDDPVTVAQVAEAVGGRSLLELLHAIAISDGLATGPAAWNDWKENLVGDLVRRVGSVLAGEAPPEPLPP